ncbi:hypothetical protein Bb109J_c1088 [Bdellovibrio bacteriovorus]|uniref:hypothetical protein n=1 Tax=Bdellovibrio bacteriovorus TaxID=959 RepID=UPI00045BF406|nr:hypothetical protein EP01_16015 [Bdellovibrio bacteriovorus]BEV67668.1 hypothetical protein Bb109J_c1088 [Bdellovibrio bacteriovorus]
MSIKKDPKLTVKCTSIPVAPKPLGHWDLQEFLNCCKSELSKIYVRREAQKDANKFYGYTSDQEICDVLTGEEFETSKKFKNTRPLEKKIGPAAEGTLTDAYTFFNVNENHIYLAFLKVNSMWVIKSFHPCEDDDFYNEYALWLTRGRM